MSTARITLKDIAKQTGFTVNTVSRALRGDQKLSESTRSCIQKAAEEAGYIRNDFASSLRSGSSHLVAIVINDICNPHYSHVISDIERSLRSAGYDILILWSSKEGDENLTGEHIIRIAVTRSVDGILYFPYQHDHASTAFMERARIPFVLVDRQVEGLEADVVRCDDYMGGKLAAEHFLSQGHQQFLYLQGPAYSSSQPERQQGFTDTLKAHGISKDAIHLLPDELLSDPETQKILLREIREKDITAALVFRDEMAYLMINQLYREGLRVPEDLSVVGFDHLHGFFPYLQPLSSIYCREDMSLGATAAKLLLERMKDPSIPAREMLFPVRLYEEGTTLRKELL